MLSASLNKTFPSFLLPSTWQDDWSGAVANKLHSVELVLWYWQSSYRRCWMDETDLCRADISYIHLTHSYILRRDSPPHCEHCQCTIFCWSTIVFAQRRKEGNVLFNDVLNTFYLWLYGVRHINPLPPHRLLFTISSKGSFICIIPQTG